MQCKSCGCSIAGANPAICPVCGKSTSGATGFERNQQSGGNIISLKAIGLIVLLAAVGAIIFKVMAP